MVTYATGDLLDEIAYLAAVLHWPLDTLLDLEHADRAHFLATARTLMDPPAADQPAPGWT